MSANAYRLKNSIVVVARNDDDYRLTELPTGSVFLPATPKPDANGMMEGTCNGGTLLVFATDLEERAERFDIRRPRATVENNPERA